MDESLLRTLTVWLLFTLGLLGWAPISASAQQQEITAADRDTSDFNKQVIRQQTEIEALRSEVDMLKATLEAQSISVE